MISVPIRDMNGGECGVYTFEPADVSDNIRKQLLHDAVVMYRSNRRVGEVQTKSRGMVAGSTRKLFKQKGTGRARAGSIRTPVRRGGGHAFGKLPRDFYYRMPKKAVRKAMRMALLSKFKMICRNRNASRLSHSGTPATSTRSVTGLPDTSG